MSLWTTCHCVPLGLPWISSRTHQGLRSIWERWQRIEQQPIKLSGQGTSVAEMLKLLGDGANGPILMALGPRSLRTKKLTEKVPTYAPRTVYRHARKLSELGLVDREEVAGVPSTVIHSLSPAGRDLYRLVESFAEASVPWISGPGSGDGLWTVLGLLGEMWTHGWLEELGQGGRSATDLAEATAHMTFHQVSRRTHQLMSWSLLYESAARGHRKRYQLSDQSRHATALIAGLGRWRQQHVEGQEERGLTVSEMGAALRAALPLLQLPAHQERSLKLGIVGTTGQDGQRGSSTLTVHVSAGGGVRCVKEKTSEDAWGIGTVDTWFATILDGDRKAMRTGGDGELVDDCLKSLHDTLWAAPAEVGAR
ncbi:MAG TPA: winged helix-turn-helix transcriptional regulator [Solirubrobacterales bacterium]|nr:winged helix-turn-helix transcriptional regulator [Solirubrobacterales bacterium]